LFSPVMNLLSDFVTTVCTSNGLIPLNAKCFPCKGIIISSSRKEWINKKIELYDIFDHANSSEHFVIMVNCSVDGRKYKLAVKFHIREKKPVHFTENHAQAILDNYRRLDDHLKTFEEPVELNTVTFIKTERNEYLWTEDYLENFQKFWGSGSFVQKIATTDNPSLFRLQVHIYRESKKEYTIVDLQGDDQEEKIILTDIEFSNTLQKFNMTNEALLGAFLRYLRNELRRQPLFIESQKRLSLPPPTPLQTTPIQDPFFFALVLVGGVALLALAHNIR